MADQTQNPRLLPTKPGFPIFLLIIFILFLGLNILFSQMVSPLFSGVVNMDKNSVVQYLKKIQSTAQFQTELEYYQKTFGRQIEDEVFKDQRLRLQKIAELEEILKRNDKARDILYGLYLLYKKEGNQLKAKEYLKQAKSVDPNIE